ncbi:hypothetical protein FNV43_RR12347 [Rhamnella rubrinervis]|uniref:Uncharacterized protein n=1 Tax=Rhamnella rubrinervis TaxID=2594499 RepID=A0A8K0H769_9ROSA|nr:hypothetical protein FNV43_RR12347 [Rhamnella rubrinervis]
MKEQSDKKSELHRSRTTTYRLSILQRERERDRNGVILQSLINPRKNWLAAQHMKAVSKRLRNYEIVDARNQRLKRAMDLSLKHEYLPENLQAVQTPFRSYLQDMLALVKKERAEREALGALPLYERTIP